MEHKSRQVPPVRVRVGPKKHKARSADELLGGLPAARCIDCGVYTCRGHAGRCENIAKGAGVSSATIKRMREGERAEVVATKGMRGKRVRREVVTMDLISCTLEKGLSLRDSGRVLGRLAREFNRLAKLEAEDALERLRDAGGHLSDYSHE